MSIDFISIIAAIAGYVLTALGTYAIAKRRGINKPWTAWVPIANLWLLGCISDQYRHVTKGQVKTKRRTMPALSCALLIASVLMIGLCVSLFIDVLPYLPQDILSMEPEALLEMIAKMSESELESFLQDVILRMGQPTPSVLQVMQVKISFLGILALVVSVGSIVLTVQTYMAYFDLFASSKPQNASTYLTLGILEQAMLWGILLPVFVYLCRDKDEGMASRPARIVDVSTIWEQSDPPYYEM